MAIFPLKNIDSIDILNASIIKDYIQLKGTFSPLHFIEATEQQFPNV